jgi:hypothetical protein
VDANRNMEFNWLVPDETGNEGASRVPCSDTYGNFWRSDKFRNLQLGILIQLEHILSLKRKQLL